MTVTDFNLTLSKEGAIGLIGATTITAIGIYAIGAIKNYKKAQKLEEEAKSLLIKDIELTAREVEKNKEKKGGKNED